MLFYEKGAKIYGGWNNDDNGIAEMKQHIVSVGLIAGEDCTLHRSNDCVYFKMLKDYHDGQSGN